MKCQHYRDSQILLKPEQVATILCFSPQTVRRLAAQKSIPAFKIGKLWRFDPKEIYEFTKAKEEKLND